MKKLTDLDKMPFGKYKNTPMQDVPASYLHWLWTQNGDPGERAEKLLRDPVLDYIQRNKLALQLEYPDGLWD